MTADPMGDVDALLFDAACAGIDESRSIFVSYLVRFKDRARWECAMQAAARDGWITTAYSDRECHLVRLSYEAEVTAQRLRDERKQVSRFARRFDGRWAALTIEQFDIATYWDMIAARRGRGDQKVERLDQDRDALEGEFNVEFEASSVAPPGGRSQVDRLRMRRAS